ncbi:MAG TPA: hypothetical protein VFH51_07500 [Myxococcota bacterium]|nr:hypothetical protein [Myxococcota bacterium]
MRQTELNASSSDLQAVDLPVLPQDAGRARPLVAVPPPLAPKAPKPDPLIVVPAPLTWSPGPTSADTPC